MKFTKEFLSNNSLYFLKVRHLNQHLDGTNLLPIATKAPINPVPCLESNVKHFDKMINLAASSIAAGDVKVCLNLFFK